MLNLAKKLRAEGVDCEIDKFVVSPPEGWPIWMQQTIDKSDFIIVVCTATYMRRFEGDEAVGTGRGAVWEGRLIQQLLYDEGGNNRVIPIVFDLSDTIYIPTVLKSATYYDVSTESGYRELHRALTNQPRVEKPPLGQIPTRLPDLDPYESTISALLRLCPDPLPFEIVGRVLNHEITEVTTRLQRLVRRDVLTIDNDTVRLKDSTAEEIPEPSEYVVISALEAALDFANRNNNKVGRAQMMNVVKLAMTADIRTAAVLVSSTFRIIQSFLKSSGDKRLVLDVARRSIEASKFEGRGLEQVKDEALATICGVSWVYQRTGRLSEALTHAERSLELGLAIHWNRNTAFCHKCIGRLKRMEAEVALDADRKSQLLEESIERLREAIHRFSKLELTAEVGDCYSLLARTYLEANNRQAARRAIMEAEDRLIDPTNKDYLDLKIVTGDLMKHISRRSAERIYTEVLATRTGVEDAQNSEILARAYLQRGRIRTASGHKNKAMADFSAAASIWEELKDPAADVAHWEIERNADWMDKEAKRLLARELVGVRVRAGSNRKRRISGTTRWKISSKKASPRLLAGCY